MLYLQMLQIGPCVACASFPGQVYYVTTVEKFLVHRRKSKIYLIVQNSISEDTQNI